MSLMAWRVSRSNRRRVKVVTPQEGLAYTRAIDRRLRDDGAGGLGGSGSGGTLSGDTLTIGSVIYQYDAPEWSEADGEWQDVSRPEVLLSDVTVTYQVAGAAADPQITQTYPAPALTIPLFPADADALLPGTLRFRLPPANHLHRDRYGDGVIYCEEGALAGIAVGSVDYNTPTLTLAQWEGHVSSLTIVSAITRRGQYSTSAVAFYVAGSPLAVGSLQLNAVEEDGDALAITDPGTGSMPSPHEGSIDHDSALVILEPESPIIAESLWYNAVYLGIQALDPEVIGLYADRLPPDGRVRTLQAGDLAMAFEDFTVSDNLTADSTVDLGEALLGFAYAADGAGEQEEALATLTEGGDAASLTRAGRTGPLEYCLLIDARGQHVAGELYSADLSAWSVQIEAGASLAGYELPLRAQYLALVDPDAYEVDVQAGTIAVAADIDHTGYTRPYVVRARKQDVIVCDSVTPLGQIASSTAIAHDYSTAAKVAGILYHGDLQARVSNVSEHHTLDNVDWDAEADIPPANGARFDSIQYPPAVSNRGTPRDQWRLVRQGDGTWRVISRSRGIVAVWDGTSTLEVRRLPSQLYPFFTLYHEALGAVSWPTGSGVQFETHAAMGPYVLARVKQPQRSTQDVQRYRVRHRVAG